MTEKELTKGAKRILDENDENVCGFCLLQILDVDGYTKKTKGSAVEVPFHLVSTQGDAVVLEAQLALNPLFFLQISSEEGSYLFGQWWLGDAKRSKTNQICDLIPKDCHQIQKQLEGDKVDFVVEALVPFLRNAPSRLVQVKFTTKEQRFVTKVVSAQVTLPKDVWQEWKQYRLKLWRSSKVWGGDDKDDDEKKEGEKKEE